MLVPLMVFFVGIVILLLIALAEGLAIVGEELLSARLFAVQAAPIFRRTALLHFVVKVVLRWKSVV